MRFAIWVQGCTLACPGCFNPETHAEAGSPTRVADLIAQIEAEAAAGSIEGVTLSGGEPFEQPEGMLALVSALRARTELSIVVFSGFSRAEIESRPQGPEILRHIDVLIDGRYVHKLRVGRGLKGSRNQTFHLLSDRYTRAALEATPEAEVTIDADGGVTLSGVGPLELPGQRKS